MKSITIAAVIGVVAQGVFWALVNKYGKISFGCGGGNGLGGLGLLFYLPAASLADGLFSQTNRIGEFFVMFIGAVQFALIAWPIVAICRALRRKDA